MTRQRRRLPHERAHADARPDTAIRLAAIDAAFRLRSTGPEPDIEELLAQIESGYLTDPSLV